MTAADRDTQLSVMNLSVSYGARQVVQDVSFEADAGEIFGLLGPSGAGKSSVLAAVSGVVNAKGIIRLGESEVGRHPARERNIGQVYQEFRLFDWMSIWDNIAFPCRAKQWNRADTDAAVSDVIQRFGLTGPPERKVRDLSGGERQRVALARAMVFRPSALLLDEPFSHLDPPLRQELKLDLIRFLQESAIPVVIVTHDHREAAELCDRVGIMCAGTLLQVGKPRDLLSRPASLDVARILGFSNESPGRIVRIEDNHVEIKLDRSGIQLLGRIGGTCGVVGSPARVVCRPERLHLSDGTKGRSNEFPARVIASHMSADETILTLELSQGETWSARATGLVCTDTGRVVKCEVATDELLVYCSSSA